MKRLFAAVAVAVLALSLSGCMNLRGDLKVGRDAKVSGTLTGEISKQVAGIVGITSLDALKSQGTSQTSQFGKVTYSETDTAYVMKVSMRGATMNDPDGFMVTRSGDGIAFKLRFSGTTTSDTGATDDLGLGNMQLGRVAMTIRFPGDVSSVSGHGATKTDDRTVKVDSPLTANSSSSWSATSRIAPPNYLLPVVASLVGLALLGGALVLLRNRRRREEPAEPAAV